MKNIKFISLVIVSLSVLPLITNNALALVSGTVYQSDIIVNDCVSDSNFIAFFTVDPPYNEYGAVFDCSNPSNHDWAFISDNSTGFLTTGVQYTLYEYDAGVGTCDIELERTACEAEAVSTSTLTILAGAGRTPYASGFTAGGVAEISTFTFSDLIPIAIVAIGIFLGLRLMDWVGHWFVRKNRL